MKRNSPITAMKDKEREEINKYITEKIMGFKWFDNVPQWNDDYCSDLNLIHEAEKKIPHGWQGVYFNNIETLIDKMDCCESITTDALTRAKALMETWDELEDAKQQSNDA